MLELPNDTSSGRSLVTALEYAASSGQQVGSYFSAIFFVKKDWPFMVASVIGFVRWVKVSRDDRRMVRPQTVVVLKNNNFIPLHLEISSSSGRWPSTMGNSSFRLFPNLGSVVVGPQTSDNIHIVVALGEYARWS